VDRCSSCSDAGCLENTAHRSRSAVDPLKTCTSYSSRLTSNSMQRSADRWMHPHAAPAGGALALLGDNLLGCSVTDSLLGDSLKQVPRRSPAMWSGGCQGGCQRSEHVLCSSIDSSGLTQYGASEYMCVHVTGVLFRSADVARGTPKHGSGIEP